MASSSPSERLRPLAARLAALPAFALAAAAARAEEPLVVTDGAGAEVRVGLREGETALVVHSLWASWCPDCAHELPQLARVARRCAGTVQVAAVNVGEALPTAQAFLARSGTDLPLLRDSEARLWRRFERGLPANLIRTREGERVVTGPYTEAAWEQLLLELGCRSENVDR